jgi:hypothetical protein
VLLLDRVGIRGAHVLAIAAIVLAAVSIRATEVYTSRYHTLPVLDWVESHPPLAEAADVPAASDLARGLARALPLLTISADARPMLPGFGPPAVVQRTIGGVRDASRIELGSPGLFRPEQAPIQARLDVIVFNRALRAAAWSELMGRELDVRDPGNGMFQARLSGPDETDAVWVTQPHEAGSIATVVGYRGAVGFMLQVTFFRPDTLDPADRADLTARAETVARQAGLAWSGWLVQQLTAQARGTSGMG